MTARHVARAIALGRVGIGVALVVAPERATRGWIGADAQRPSAAVLARALGARDFVLGAIALHTIGNPEIGPRWQRTLAGVDAADLGATLIARRQLPRSGVAMVVAMAAGGAAAQLWAARGLADA